MNAHINDLQAIIAQTLQRCANLPVPDSGRFERIANFRAQLGDLVRRSNESFASIGKNERGALDAAIADVANVQRRIRQLDVDLHRSDAEFQRKQSDLQMKLAEAQKAGSGDHQKAAALTFPIQQELNATSSQQNAAQALLRSQAQGLQQFELPERQMKQSDAQRAFNERVEELRLTENAELSAVLPEIESLLDKVGAFEQELQVQTGAQVQDKVRAEFASKSDAFIHAADYHQKQTRHMFWLMVGLVVVTCIAIYFLFFDAHKGFPALPANAVVASPAGAQQAVQGSAIPGLSAAELLERLLFVGVGRIAALAILALALRYAARLHRAHSEQQVIYRDRVAALGVAQTIIEAAPYEKKFDFLKTLSDGYLSFEQNAFRVQSLESNGNPSAVSKEAIANLRATMDAMKPAFDAVKTIVEKVK